MTAREPSAEGFGMWVERLIRQAAERGELDTPTGAGKPIPDLDQPYDEAWWIKRKLRQENLSYMPRTLALRKEAEDALDAVARARSERQVRRIVEDINHKILEANRKATSGPPLNLMPLDVERLLESWRDRQAE